MRITRRTALAALGAALIVPKALGRLLGDKPERPEQSGKWLAKRHCVFTGMVGNDWGDKRNWCCEAMPHNGDIVTFQSGKCTTGCPPDLHLEAIRIEEGDLPACGAIDALASCPAAYGLESCKVNRGQ